MLQGEMILYILVVSMTIVRLCIEIRSESAPKATVAYLFIGGEKKNNVRSTLLCYYEQIIERWRKEK